MQAEVLAKKLAGKSITRIYTSPIPRAKETAEILSVALMAPVECADGLREPDCGILEGGADEAAWEEHNYWKEAWLQGYLLEWGPQGGETCKEVRTRLDRLIKKLIADYGESDAGLLLVTHGALILFGLPELVSGADQQTLLESGLTHTTLICTELQNGKLVLKGLSTNATGLEGE